MALIEYLKTLFIGKNFARVMLAFIWTGAGIWLIYYLLTNELSGSMKEFGNTVIGYVMGVISTVITFYFGSSQSSSDKDDVIKAKVTEQK